MTNNKSSIGFRKRIENRKKNVLHKWNDLISFNVGTSKRFEEEKTSCFSLFIATAENEFHLTLNADDAKKMIEFFKDEL